MATYVLVPGAGGDSWYWHLVVQELQQRGHEAVAVDLPAGDDSAGMTQYADAVIEAVAARSGLVLVAQSLAAFSATMVCDRISVDLLVLVNAMIPRPDESAGQWWANTGQAQARAELAAREGRTLDGDPQLLDAFFHDVPAEVTGQAMERGEVVQSETPFEKPWPLRAWPDVPTRCLIGRDDRFFPAELQRRVARERLGITPDEMPGGHLVALSRPRELVERLESYRAGIATDA